MLSLSKSVLINIKIAQFYKIEKSDELENLSEFFQASGAFDSIKIVEYIWPNLKSAAVFKDLENYKYEDYIRCFNNLLPIFQYTSKILHDFNEIADNVLKIQWMGNNVKAYLDMKSNYNNNKTETFEHTLILTSLLANALTNAYLSQINGKHAPHLLKDLINSFEIRNLFGLEMVILLKVLMGAPNSINLRNIVWHGFPKPMEIPDYYVNVLLITIHSLGCVIETRKIQTADRNLITNFNEHIKPIKQNSELKSINLAYIEEKLEKIDNDFKIYWQQLLFYYKSEKYKEFIVLVLPQVELLLRLHYGTVNNCDVSAKLDEYYITMDTIFKSTVLNGESSNKLLDFENSILEGCLHLLYDIFISPNGCRLRDKVSHGEVYLDALNNSELCMLVLHIFIVLLFPEEFKVFENYESKLHLNSTSRAKLIICYTNLKIFYTNYLESKLVLTLKSLVPKHNKLLIFNRHKKESELILLINKVAENVCKTSLNYEESIEIRCALLARRELHSKRRNTLDKLKTALPDIFKTLVSIISSCDKIFMVLQSDCSYVLDKNLNYDKTLRFLKRCLTISEHFVKYSHCENNEWIKALELCRKHDEFHKKLFLYDD